MPRRRFDTLDISDEVNRELTPDPAGSPQSQGVDYSWLSPGTMAFEVPEAGRLPFNIIDQSHNGGRAVAITQGGLVDHQPSMAFPPRFDFDVPQNIQSRIIRVHVLGVAAYWAWFSCELEGTLGAELFFTYTDGTQVVQPLVNGIHYTDWANRGFEELRRNGDGTQVITAVQAACSRGDYDTRADILTIDLMMHSHRQLRRVALVDSGSPASIPIVAITLEREVTVTTEASEVGTAALRDLAPAVRLGERKRLNALLESLVSDIGILAQENLYTAQSRAAMLTALFSHAIIERGNTDPELEKIPLRAACVIADARNAAGLANAIEETIAELMTYLYSKKRMHTERVIGQATDYIRRHYANELKDEDLAAFLNLSNSHFRHLFREHTGMSFGKYFTLVRMENARRLLEESSLTVSEIAHKVGYDDVSYFSRVFSQYFWVSPTEYRKSSS